MDVQDVQYEYDIDMDYLYASIGGPRLAVAVEVGDGVYVRVTPEWEVCGIEILECGPLGIIRENLNKEFVSELITRFGKLALERTR